MKDKTILKKRVALYVDPKTHANTRAKLIKKGMGSFSLWIHQQMTNFLKN